MATELDSRPSATTLDVEELVRMAWSGKIRVPHFQRDFRWGWEDVRRLFDSIVKGYPIGSLLLWTRKAPATELRLGALHFEAPAMSDANWVVDGQQRLTSIANALHPDGQLQPRFALSYDVTTKEFIRTPPAEHPTVIPLPVLFDLQQILKWFAKYPMIDEHLDHATSITRKIRQFEVPAYLVRQDDPQVLQDIFDRMNNYGKRLSRAEIFSALNAGEESDKDNTLTFDRIADRIDVDLQFGKIDNDTVLGAVLARRGAEVRRDIRTEFTKENDEGRDAAYQAGEEALRRAVAFLQNEAGVPHITFLAYRYLIVVLARLFAFHPVPDPRNLRLIRRWYWKAAVGGPEQFKGGTTNAARVLCSKVVEHSLTESVQGLLSTAKDENPRLPDLSRFSTNEASTKMTLCAWWAASPRNLLSGEIYEQADLAEVLADQATPRQAVRYLMPRSWVPFEYKQRAANRALMPGLEVDNKEISGLISHRSIKFSQEEWMQILRSHLIPTDATSLLTSEKTVDFLKARQKLLEDQLMDFLNKMCEWGFENTPPLSSFVLDDEDEDDN